MKRKSRENTSPDLVIINFFDDQSCFGSESGAQQGCLLESIDAVAVMAVLQRMNFPRIADQNFSNERASEFKGH